VARLFLAPLLLSVTLGVAGAEPEAPVQFVQTLVNAGFHVDGYASGGGPGERVLMLVGHNEKRSNLLGVYPIEADGRVASPVARFQLPESFVFFDQGPQGRERSQLTFLATDGVWRYDVNGHRLMKLVEVKSLYREPTHAGLSALDFVMDINGDGREDLAIPDFEGYRLFLQDEDGKFANATLLPVRPRMQMINRVHLPRGVPRYLRYHMYRVDLDGDQRIDLAFVRDGELVGFIQNEEGSYDTTARNIVLDLDLTPEYLARALDSDDVDVDHSHLTLRQVQDLRDLNADGIPDIVVQATISSGVLDKKTEYHVHLGRLGDEGLRFNEQADSVVRSDGFQFYLTKVDMNADGRLDLMSPSIGFGVRQLIGALFTGRIGMDVAFYGMQSDGTYPEEPAMTRDVSVKFDLSSGYVDWPAMDIADFDGDGVADLLIQKDGEHFEIFPGNGSAQLFADDPWTVNTVMPRDGERVDALDLDRDGKSDILMRYSSADGEAEALKIRVLVAR